METTKNGHVAVRFVDGGEYRVTVVPVDLEFRTESGIGHSLYRLHLRVVTDDSDGFQGQKVQVSFWDRGDHERVEFIRALIGRRCHAEFHGELRGKYRNYWLDEIVPLDGEEAERIAAAVPERLAQSVPEHATAVPATETVSTETEARLDRDTASVLLAAVLTVVETVMAVPAETATGLVAEHLGAAEGLLACVRQTPRAPEPGAAELPIETPETEVSAEMPIDVPDDDLPF
jgi:hypothetical protein